MNLAMAPSNLLPQLNMLKSRLFCCNRQKTAGKKEVTMLLVPTDADGYIVSRVERKWGSIVQIQRPVFWIIVVFARSFIGAGKGEGYKITCPI